ncbi:MAG: hypothetical protein L6R37_006387 [Teloschistes peruensis]|nr:MAG: hypothetical protein L6R37_006387 [Teloschistes peruensis]
MVERKQDQLRFCHKRLKRRSRLPHRLLNQTPTILCFLSRLTRHAVGEGAMQIRPQMKDRRLEMTKSASVTQANPFFTRVVKIEGCKQKKRHMFVGSGKKDGKEEALSTVRHDFYQTPTTVIASFFLKKINKERAKINFSSQSEVILDLPTADNKRYKTNVPLFGQIDTTKSTSKIMGTKLELTLAKLDGASWPTLRSDETRTNEITQIGPTGRA